MISHAASIPNHVFDRLAQAGAFNMSLGDVKNQTLTQTLILTRFIRLSDKPDDKQAQARRAELDMFPGQAGLAKPAALAEALCKGRPGTGGLARAAYASFIHPEYVTDLTRNVQGDTMTGTVSFEVKDVYRGRIQYTARRGADGWRVVDLCMPAWGLRTTLGSDGLWQAWVRPGPDGPVAIDRDMEVTLPEAGRKNGPIAPSQPPIVVNIRKDGSTVLDGRQVSPAELAKALGRAVKADPDRKVLLRADADVRHKHVASCLTICHEAGIRGVNIGYVTEKGAPARR